MLQREMDQYLLQSAMYAFDVGLLP